MVINLWRLDKYESKHTGILTNIQANIGKTYEQTINGHTDRQEIYK